MKTSAVFKAAKKGLWNGIGECQEQSKERYICHAIYWRVIDCSYVESRKALKIISLLLEGHDTLEEWLWAKHRIRANNNTKKLQQTRQAWLDHLIAHYKSIGD
jgi:hypothetical protein